MTVVRRKLQTVDIPQPLEKEHAIALQHVVSYWGNDRKFPDILSQDHACAKRGKETDKEREGDYLVLLLLQGCERERKRERERERDRVSRELE